MDEQSAQDELEQAEETYRSHVETRRRLGTTLEEVMRKDGDHEEFRLLRQNLNRLINEADLKRTELYYERLTQRLKVVEAEHKLAWKAAHEEAESLEAARKAYAQAAGQEQRLSTEVRRLEELRRREMERLEQLRKKEQEEHETPVKTPIHVLPREDGWAVVHEGDERATSTHPTQAQAAKAGRELARKARSAFLLHAKDGRVRDRSDYGEEPALRPKGQPPKGEPESPVPQGPANEATRGSDEAAAGDGRPPGIVGEAVEGPGSAAQGGSLGGGTSAEGSETGHRTPG